MNSFSLLILIFGVCAAQQQLNGQQQQYNNGLQNYNGQQPYRGQYQNQYSPYRGQYQNQYNRQQPYTAQPQYVPQQRNVNDVVTTRSENENNLNGNYRWAYETSDGSQQEAIGEGRASPDPQNPIIQTVQGSYSYIAPDGRRISVRYVADENGYRPVSEHLPQQRSFEPTPTTRPYNRQFQRPFEPTPAPFQYNRQFQPQARTVDYQSQAPLVAEPAVTSRPYDPYNRAYQQRAYQQRRF